MSCSSSLPIIGVDIDNVIADTDSMIRKLIFKYFGIRVLRDQIVTWNYHENISISKDQEKFVFEQFHKHYCDKVNLIFDSKEALCQLIKGSEIWLITQRPQCSKAMTQTWLAKMKLPYTKLIFAENKTEYAGCMSFFVEDNKDTALALAQIGIKTFLIDCPWNRDILCTQNIIRVKGWKEILLQVLKYNLAFPIPEPELA